MQKFKVNNQSVLKIEWKQTDGWMEAIALPPSRVWLIIIMGEQKVIVLGHIHIAYYTNPSCLPRGRCPLFLLCVISHMRFIGFIQCTFDLVERELSAIL